MDIGIKELYEFIDRAIKNRKYQPTSGQTLRAAIKAFDPELTDEERKSIDTFRKNLDQIANTIYSKKGSSVSAASLSTYKSRTLKVINDYEKYGTDSTKMANWNPPAPILRKKKVLEPSDTTKQDEVEVGDNDLAAVTPVPVGMHKLELELRPGTKFVLILPYDLKRTEVAKIGAILGSLAIDEGGDELAELQATPNK